jgi:hypothetical protein
MLHLSQTAYTVYLHVHRLAMPVQLDSRQRTLKLARLCDDTNIGGTQQAIRSALGWHAA